MANGGTTLTPDEQRLVDIKAHRITLNTTIKELQADYSKQLLALSSATLAVSVAFLRNVVDVPHAVWMCLLYTAWALFVGTIVLTLVSIQVSVKAHKFYREEIDQVIASKKRPEDIQTWGDWMVPVLTLLSSLFFVGGFACLALFAGINVRRERTMPEKTHDTQTLPSGIKEDGNKNTIEVQKLPPVKEAPPPPPPTQTPEKK